MTCIIIVSKYGEFYVKICKIYTKNRWFFLGLVNNISISSTTESEIMVYKS